MSVTTLAEALTGSGAELDPESSRPLHFGDPAAELCAALDGCVVADRSDLGRILATGPDLLDLLNRLSTNAVQDLSAGQGRSTAVTTAKGRIVERLWVHHLGDPGVLMVAGPGGAERAVSHLDRYTFAEQTGLADVTGSWCQVALIGPRAAEALDATRLPAPENLGASGATLGGAGVHVLGEDGLSATGFSVTAPMGHASEIWSALTEAVSAIGGRPAGDQAVEAWRVLRGLPAGGHELDEGHNPLEAGLWESVSFDKGCYVGQEVVARLNTYDKVARVVKGLVLSPDGDQPETGTPLYAGGRRIGEVTSSLVPPGRSAPVALAYVKRDFAKAGSAVRLGADDTSPTVAVVDLPFGDTP